MARKSKYFRAARLPDDEPVAPIILNEDDDDEPVAPIILDEDDEVLCDEEIDEGEYDPDEGSYDPLEQLGEQIAEMLPPSCRTPEQMRLLGEIIGFGLGYYGSRPFWKWLFGVEE